jgi:tetratricopeptide (TPR) repeat protein
MRANRDQLVRDLYDWISSAEQPKDLPRLLDPALLDLARELAATFDQDAPDVATPAAAVAAGMIVAVHWSRYQLLPDGQDQDDFRSLLKWSAVLTSVAPHLVPEPVRDYLADAASSAGAAAGEAGGGVAVMYEDYQRTGNIESLQSAIALLREEADAAAPGDQDWPRRLSNLGAALQVRFERTGEVADLDEAIMLGREAAESTPPGDQDRPGRLSNLGAALRVRYGHTGRPRDLDDAITYGRAAVAAAPPGHEDRPAALSNLAAAVQVRFERTGQALDLDQAINLNREAIDATQAGDLDWPSRLANLGTALQVRFERTGQLGDLDEAITVSGAAVSAAVPPHPHPHRARYLSNLGNALRVRFDRTGQAGDLERAIAVSQEAVDTAPDGHPDRPRYLSNLGNALRARFERTGRQSDLDQAVACFRAAVDATSAERPDLSRHLSNLGAALLVRFGRTGQVTDLDEAIAASRAAVDIAPSAHPFRALYLSNLGNALQDRFRRSGQQADLDEAIAVNREAVDTSPADHPDRPMRLSNFGSALRLRFERTGDPSDLDVAISRLSEARSAIPVDHAERSAVLSNLGAALLARFRRSAEQSDLDEAIAVTREAIDASPADHPDRALRLANLGTGLRLRFERLRQAPDLAAALEAFRGGAAVLTAPPGRRVDAARGWGQCAMLAGEPGSAVAGYATAIELLPLVAWHGLDQPTREHHLRESTGLACDAAAAAIAAGQPARAVELLEAGRSVLWTQALHLREDLAVLRERAPDLAAALEASRAVLNTAADDPRTAGAAGQAKALEKRRQAARDWDDAIGQVRSIKGFERFLLPFPFPALRAAASGPVVVVNISRHSSHALIVAPAAKPGLSSAPRVVGLPGARFEIVADQANTLLAALQRASDPALPWPAREADRHAVFNVLAWSWQVIAEPILAALGHTGVPRGRIEDWPRVWWCPTGPATVLPLHAAGQHPRTATQHATMGEAAAIADTVAGRVVSSYTQNLTSLAHTNARPAPGRVRQLAVGVPEAPAYAPGASSLPTVTDELRAVARHVPTPGRATSMIGPAAIRQAVLDALPGHSWLHLSCHGVQDQADASRSAFLLYDQPLTVTDLAALNLRETDLAYLAACQTAFGDLRLLDEALHLAGALQVVGYRHVLATLWSISDAAAPTMADLTYAYLVNGRNPGHPCRAGKPSADRAAHALHHAVTRLRQSCPDEPLLWAPYIHIGP